MGIFVTGDLHGDFSRIFNNRIINKLTCDDILILLGDVGLIFDSKATIREKFLIERLKRIPCTLAFISGNHDNEERLDQYPVSDWCGGKAHIISKKKNDGSQAIVHMMRGQVYNIRGKRIWAFGGAKAHENAVILDKNAPDYLAEKKRLEDSNIFYRVKGIDYWDRCTASLDEMNDGIMNLDKVDYRVDYILTHCAPSDIQTEIYGGDTSWTNNQTDYLQKVVDNTNFSKWLFGHYHCNCEYKNGLFQCVYDDVYKLHN